MGGLLFVCCYEGLPCEGGLLFVCCYEGLQCEGRGVIVCLFVVMKGCRVRGGLLFVVVQDCGSS